MEQAYELDFTKAQLRHFNELQAAVQRAQAALQAFADYLAEEHEMSAVELPAGYQWQIGPKGFRAVPGGNPMGAQRGADDSPVTILEPMAAMQNGSGG